VDNLTIQGVKHRSFHANERIQSRDPAQSRFFVDFYHPPARA